MEDEFDQAIEAVENLLKKAKESKLSALRAEYVYSYYCQLQGRFGPASAKEILLADLRGGGLNLNFTSS